MLVLDVSSVACKTAWYIAIADTTPPLSISPCTLLCIVLVSVVRACGTIERWCGAQYAHLCLEIYMCVCKRLWVFATATLLLWNARTGVCTVQPALHLCYYICTRHTYQSLAGWTLFYSAEQSFIPFDICHFYLYYVRCFVRYVIWVRGTYIIIINIIIIVVLCQCEMACIVCDHVINLSTLAVVIAATFVLCSTQVQPFIYMFIVCSFRFFAASAFYLSTVACLPLLAHRMNWLTAFGFVSFISISICWFDCIVVIRVLGVPAHQKPLLFHGNNICICQFTDNDNVTHANTQQQQNALFIRIVRSFIQSKPNNGRSFIIANRGWRHQT